MKLPDHVDGKNDNDKVQDAIGSFSRDEHSLETRAFALYPGVPSCRQRNTSQNESYRTAQQPEKTETAYDYGTTPKGRGCEYATVEAQSADLDGCNYQKGE